MWLWIKKKEKKKKQYFGGLAECQRRGKTTISSIIKSILEK